MICCLFRYSTDAGTSSCLWRFNPLLLRLLGEISHSLLCLDSSWGSALDLDTPLHVGHLRASVLHSQRSSCFRGSGSLWPGEVGVQVWGEPAAAEAGMMLWQPEVCRVFSQGSCPWVSLLYFLWQLKML